MATCLFCVMHVPMQPVAVPFLPDDICEAHREGAGISEYLTVHPDGRHTETCGCMSHDELKRRQQGEQEADRE